MPHTGVVKGSHPPRNNKVASAQTMNKFTNSARKKAANLKPLYSILNPATISDSASGISKGVLLISAREAVKKIGDTKISGTHHRFFPDSQIFKDAKFDLREIIKKCRQHAYLTAGLKFTIRDEREGEKNVQSKG